MRLALGLLLSCLAWPALAQVSDTVWDDPTLALASRSADLIVLARAEKIATNGAAYRVERTVKGPKRDGDLLAITGLHHAELRERPPIEAGDRAFLILVGDPKGEGFSLPTPTFGRFVVKGEQAVLSFGGADTFLRLAVPEGRAEAILAGFAAEPSAGERSEILRWAEEVVAGEDSEGEALYVALNVLASLGGARSAPAAARVLKNPRWAGVGGERVRMSAARVLGRAGRERGARTLVAVAADAEQRPAVISVALAQVPAALGAKPSAEALRVVCRELAKLAPRLRTAPIRYGQANDPRRNFVPSPLAACLRSIARLRSSAGVRPALRALESEDLEAIQAGLAYFEELGDPERALSIAKRMRPAGHRDGWINRAFAVSLRELTGQRFGDDREAWIAWCKEQDREREGAVGPPRPGGGK